MRSKLAERLSAPGLICESGKSIRNNWVASVRTQALPELFEQGDGLTDTRFAKDECATSNIK